jgi:glycosyltransferase involved in cell wall biosynthesis
MSRQRVLFLTASAGSYGGENALTDALRHLPPEFEPIVLVPEPGELVKELEGAGIQTRIVPFAVLDRKYFHPLRILFYKASAIASIFRLIGIFREFKPDIVHTNNVLVLPGAIAARMLGIPHVWHIREIIEGHHIHPILWKLWRWIILTCSERVICISRAVADQFKESPKVVVIHDGVDTNVFHPITGRTRRTSRPRTTTTVGIVGRLDHRRKGQDLFIEAARIASESRQDLRFIIVGHEREGVEEREEILYEMVRDGKLEQKMEFRGFVPREQMSQLMNELDVLVLCSKRPKGLGIVLLEAMACGKAVISFAEGGPLDIIEDRWNGLLTKPQDPRQLAEAILELANDPKLRKALGSEGRKMVEGSFGNDQTVQRMAELYRTIMKVKRETAHLPW